MHTVGILVFAGLSYVVRASECGDEGCKADGRTQETGSSMLQSRAPSKSNFVLLVEAGQKLSTQMGIDASSAVGKMMDKTMDMILRAEGIGDSKIVAQVQGQLTEIVENELRSATQYEKDAYEKKLTELNNLTYDKMKITKTLEATNKSGNEAVVCNQTYTDKIKVKEETCNESAEIKKNIVFPEECKIDALKKHATQATAPGVQPVCKHFTTIGVDYDNYYAEFATELKKCVTTIEGLSSTAKSADKNCTDAEKDTEEQAKTCNETEAKLEIKLCEASAALTEECSSYSKEYEEKKNALAKTKGINLQNIAARENQYRGLELIMCFLNTLAEEDTGVDQKAAFEKCQQKEADVSPVQYSMADPDPMKTCDYSAQIAEFISGFKDHLRESALADCNLTIA
jgi:hypothetical protein